MNNNTWIELNATDFDNNIKQIKNIIGDTVNLSVVVKGNAYGHGLIPIASLCQQNNYVDWLCTISLSEALTLRANNITKPILVLSYIDANPTLAIEHAIDLIVQDIETACLIHEHAQKIQKPARIHIKVDTGLSRLGFSLENVIDAIKYLLQLPYLIIHGISTHFADVNNPQSTFITRQSTLFRDLLHALPNHAINIPIKHAANSAATIRYPENHFNFVRVGAAAYGLLLSTDRCQQTPIATWKTAISFIRTVHANSFVGYDLLYHTPTKMKIAILPVGYYDGYNRRLSNISTVLVHNARLDTYEYAPVIGRVAMNHTFIDITHIEHAALGDTVILLGPYEKIRPYDIAQYTQSYNPRELTTTIHESIKRVIVEGTQKQCIADNNSNCKKNKEGALSSKSL